MPIAGTNFGWGSSAATPSPRAAWVSGGSLDQQTLLAVAMPALFVAVLILAGVRVRVGVTVGIRIGVTVAMSMVVMSIPIPVPMFIVSASMSMGSMAVTVLVVTITVTVAVAIRVTVLVVTVAGLTAARPILAPLVAVALHASRDGYAPLFGVDRVHASVEHARGEVPTPVLTGGRCLAVLLETDGQCQPGFHVAFVQVTAGLDTVIAQLGGDGFAFLIAGGQLRLFAVLRDALGMRFPSKLDASGFVATWLESIEALLEHRSGGKLTPILTGDAVLRDALGKRFPSKLDASGFVATWLESIEALLEHRSGGKLTPILTGDAVLRDALGKRFPSKLDASGFVATWLESIEALLEHRSGGKLTPILTGDAVLRDALGKRFPSKLDASGFVATWLESIEALLEHRSGGKLTAALTGRWLGIAAVLCDAVRQRFPGDRSTALFLATVTSGSVFTSGSGLGLETAVLDASIVDFPGVALAPIFAGRLLWRRALPGALEEAVDRAPEALLPTDTRVVFRASVEDGKRRSNTIITALAGRHAFTIGGLVQDRRKLRPFARGVTTAALQKQNGSCKNGEYGCCEFHDCLPRLQRMVPKRAARIQQ